MLPTRTLFAPLPPPPNSHPTVHEYGALNDPSVPASGWSAEIAFPLALLAYNTSATVPPANGTMWRINFSRVE